MDEHTATGKRPKDRNQDTNYGKGPSRKQNLQTYTRARSDHLKAGENRMMDVLGDMKWEAEVHDSKYCTYWYG